MAFVIFLVIVAITVAYGVMLYNGLVQVKHGVTKAWANIDVLLKQRHDELPKLVETCRQYMKYEQETLEKVIEARSKVYNARQVGDVQAVGTAEGGLRASLGNLFALAEQYPDLKANNSFVQLQTRISGLEEAIADRREFYNEAVNVNNVAIEQFPAVIIANAFGFKAAQLLEFEASEKADVDIKQLFS